MIHSIDSTSSNGEAISEPTSAFRRRCNEIAADGDIVLRISHRTSWANYELTFRVGLVALRGSSTYFERLLQTGRFEEGALIAERHRDLCKKHGSLTKLPSEQLPVVNIEDIGRISAVKSIEPLMSDFLCILHGKDVQTSLPTANLANLAVVADRFSATECLRAYVKRKKVLQAIDGKTTPKQDTSLSEEKTRQRLLVGLMLDYPTWIEKYSARVIAKGWVSHEADISDALWWDLPGRVEEEIALRRECVLETIQSLQAHFLNLYSTRTRQCRLGYDSSPECDSFQFGEMVRFFIRTGTLRLKGTMLTADDDRAAYEGDIFLLLERMKQVPEYQIDRNHSHCGIRTRLVPLVDLVAAALQHVGLCGECWAEDWAKHAWIEAKRPLMWKRQRHQPQTKVEDHDRRHDVARAPFMATERDWT